MRRSTACAVSLFASMFAFSSGAARAQAPASHVFGYEDFSQQAKWDHAFMEIPECEAGRRGAEDPDGRAALGKLAGGPRDGAVCGREVQGGGAAHRDPAVPRLAEQAGHD